MSAPETHSATDSACAVLLAPLFATWAATVPEAFTVLARGGDPTALFALFGLATVLGLPLIVALGLVVGVGAGGGRLLGWVSGRFGHPVPPSRLVAVALALAFVVPMHHAHLTMVKHVMVAVLMSGYAIVAAVLLALILDRARDGLRARPWRVGVSVVLGGVAVHAVNAMLFTGLYPELHRALTWATIGLWTAGAAVLLSRWPWRRQLVVFGALALVGLMAWAVGRALDVDRAAIAFHGTESAHATALIAGWTDGDGDGIAPTIGGRDCDDTDRAVHPLAFEVPENGVDDNCRLGDATRTPPAPLRPVHPSVPAATSWRSRHGGIDVLMIFVDTLRWDAVGPESTPNMDRLARRSVVFDQARTPVGRTPHAWMSIIRARFTERAMRCRSGLIPPGDETLIHRMQSSGRRTVGRFVGRSWPRYHLDGGWDAQRMGQKVKVATGALVARDTVRWLKNDKPIFIVAHFADPHAPYLAEPAAGKRDLRARYAAEVKATDTDIGAVLDAVETRARPTLVVLFADHGENLGEHGQVGGHHGGLVFDEVVRVPLMISGPEIEPRVVDAPVSVIDIAPTILSLTGSTSLPGADGRSLAGYLFGAPPPPSPTISGFFDFGHRLRSIVDGRLKLIVDERSGGRMLFDVIDDPGELRDLARARPADADRLQALLDGWVEYEADPAVGIARCRNLTARR